VPPLTLLQAFRTYCHERRADRHAAVLAAGFTPVPAAPPGDAGSETAAWEKDGIRLFEMSGQADRYLLLPAACGVSANVGMVEDSNAFEAPFIADPDYLWLEVTHHNKQIYWNLILRSGFVRASFDRTDPAAVRMTFAGTGEPLPQSETR
jgi:hypothetical protein